MFSAHLLTYEKTASHETNQPVMTLLNERQALPLYAYFLPAVFQLKESLQVDWFHETPFSHMLASALKTWCGAEIGMVNAGVLLEGLEEGVVTRGDIHRICPHPINPCALKVSR